MFIWILVHFRNPINVRQIVLLTICLYSERSEDRFVVVQHFWCRKICQIVGFPGNEWSPPSSSIKMSFYKSFTVQAILFSLFGQTFSSSPAYGVFISQLIRYARACSSYECFILRARRLSSKLLKQGYLVERLKVLWSIRGSCWAIWSNPLTNVKWHSDPWPTVTSLPIRLSINFMTFIPSLTFTELWVVSMEHMQRVWLASRERLPFRTPGSVPHFGLANAPIVETKLLELAMSLLDFSPRIPLGTFSILLG